MTFGDLASIPRTPMHFWSLAVEEHFYLLWPILVLSFSNKIVGRICWGAIVGALILRVWLISIDIPVGLITPTRIDELAAGGLVAVALEMGTLDLRSRAFRNSLLVFLPLLAVGFAKLSGARLPAVQALKYSFTGYVYVALLIMTLSEGLIRTAMENRWLRETGKYSYAMYVLHYSIVQAVHRAGVELWVGFAAAILLTYICAWLSWRLIESPILRMKSYFPYRDRRSIVEPAVA